MSGYQVRAVADTPEQRLRDYTARLQAIVTMRRVYRVMTASLAGLFGVSGLLAGLLAHSAAGGFSLAGGGVFFAVLWLGGVLTWRGRPATERALNPGSHPPAGRTPGNVRGAFFAAAGMGCLAAVVCGLSFMSSNPPHAVLKLAIIGLGTFVVFTVLFVPPGYVYAQSDQYFAKWLNRNRAAYQAAARRL
ncbi:hypothetical protein [Amycolatopsis dendrobii]|uniref:Transmembrane protein n=1 Tax=Amycolatopsis dendrobii TaxID=2760662 RepID=A0A7W3Z9S3_9PSEU|nr:hypothetical protein [Amycolatopsis dendrobii]MBB1153044.1 hypothetical protein [Amycolatopsis dendrobii]